jgi:hypothetical protein
MNENKLKFEETDDTGNPKGRQVVFSGVEFSPLQYADLIGMKLSDKAVIPMNWKRARILESNIPGITVGGFAAGHATLESSHTSKSIGLVRGGWLPSGLALKADMIVLPDRCIISELKGRFLNGVKKKKEDKDFLDIFSDNSIRVNPLLYALESNLRYNPTPAVIKQQLDDAYRVITLALPKAQLVPRKEDALQGILGIVQDTQSGIVRKQKFLTALAPRLQAPTSARNKDILWDEILTTAQSWGVPKNSLVVVAALSTISVPMGKSPAKRLLNFKSGYSMEDAYNALADLRSLEILMHGFARFPDQQLMLCTGDKDLALFWAAIRASDFVWSGRHASFNVSPVDALLPGATPAQMVSCFGASEEYWREEYCEGAGRSAKRIGKHLD